MGLFDKKFCGVCGEKIGFLGNRKLDDGNLCKNCAAKLSPFFEDRRHSTLAQIREQLAYREQNKAAVASLNPTLILGRGMKIWIDEAAQAFAVARTGDFPDKNPDVIAFSQVTDCRVDVNEHKTEQYTKDANGNRVSYKPPRYDYAYEFKVTILVQSPWFDDITFELSEGRRPDGPYTELFHQYEREADELKRALSGHGQAGGSFSGANFSADPAVRNPVSGAPIVSSAPAEEPEVSASGEHREKFLFENALSYSYQADGFSGTVRFASVSGFISYRITNPALYRQNAAKPGTIPNAFGSAMAWALSQADLTGVNPTAVFLHPKFKETLALQYRNWGLTIGVEFAAVGYGSVRIDPEDEKAIREASGRTFMTAAGITPEMQAAMAQAEALSAQADGLVQSAEGQRKAEESVSADISGEFAQTNNVYRYQDPDLGVDLDIGIPKISGRYTAEIANAALWSVSKNENAAQMISSTVQTSLVRAEKPGLHPQDIAEDPGFLELLRDAASDALTVLGLRLTSLSVDPFEIRENDLALLAQAEAAAAFSKRLSDPETREEALKESAKKLAEAAGIPLPDPAEAKWDCPVCGGKDNVGGVCEYCGSEKPKGV